MGGGGGAGPHLHSQEQVRRCRALSRAALRDGDDKLASDRHQGVWGVTTVKQARDGSGDARFVPGGRCHDRAHCRPPRSSETSHARRRLISPAIRRRSRPRGPCDRDRVVQHPVIVQSRMPRRSGSGLSSSVAPLADVVVFNRTGAAICSAWSQDLLRGGSPAISRRPQRTTGCRCCCGPDGHSGRVSAPVPAARFAVAFACALFLWPATPQRCRPGSLSRGHRSRLSHPARARRALASGDLIRRRAATA